MEKRLNREKKQQKKLNRKKNQLRTERMRMPLRQKPRKILMKMTNHNVNEESKREREKKPSNQKPNI